MIATLNNEVLKEIEKWMKPENTYKGYLPSIKIEFPDEDEEFKLMSKIDHPQQLGCIINFGWETTSYYMSSHSISI